MKTRRLRLGPGSTSGIPWPYSAWVIEDAEALGLFLRQAGKWPLVESLRRNPSSQVTSESRELVDAIEAELERWSPGRRTSESLHNSLMSLHCLTGGTPNIYQMRPAASAVVSETDLAEFPDKAFRLLWSPFIVEARRPETGERLYGETIGISCFLGVTRGERLGFEVEELAVGDDGELLMRCFMWFPAFGAPLSDGVESDWNDPAVVQAVRFITVLGLLLEAEKTPIEERPEKCQAAPSRAASSIREWTTRHIYLNAEAQRRARAESQGELSKDGLLSAEVPVRGHLKRQHHGPENSLTKWIYVEGYSQRKWIAPRPVRNVVGVRMQ